LKDSGEKHSLDVVKGDEALVALLGDTMNGVNGVEEPPFLFGVLYEVSRRSCTS